MEEKFETPSPFIRAAVRTYPGPVLGAAELGPRKGCITSEQLDYIDSVKEESRESFKNRKSCISLYYTWFYYSTVHSPYLTLQYIFILNASACLICAWKLWCFLNSPIQASMNHLRI